MGTISSRSSLGGVAASIMLALPVAAPGQVTGLHSGAAGDLSLTGPWTRSDPEARFMPPPSGPGPLQDDPAHPHHGHREGIPGQPDESATPWVADLRNPILKPWVADIVRKNGEQGLAGVEADTALLHCRPDGVPGVLTRRDNVSLLQTPTEVTIIYQLDHQVRHIYLNRRHSENPAESWYGESVGHFDGDTLVVDTIGLNDLTTLDNYNTPHSDVLHVVEHYHVVDGGRTLQVDFKVDDPKAFNLPWSAIVHYRRSRGANEEFVCAENNANIWTGKSYPIPIATTADF